MNRETTMISALQACILKQTETISFILKARELMKESLALYSPFQAGEQVLHDSDILIIDKVIVDDEGNFQYCFNLPDALLLLNEGSIAKI